MKKSSKKNVITVCLGTALILGVSGLTIFSSAMLVNRLNADADMQYVAAVNDTYAKVLETKPEYRDNDNDDVVSDVPSEDGTFLVDQLSDTESPLENESVKTSDTEVSADDSEAVTYPYYIGTEFVVVDPEGNMVYVVKKGDTLSAVSRMVGYSVDELAEYNHIKNVNLIYVDESLRIPADEDLVESVKKYIESCETTDDASSEDVVDSDAVTESQQE